MANIKQIVGSKYESIKAHMVSIESLCKEYNTDVETGLTANQAKENLVKYGPNKMKDMPECTMVKRDGEFQRINTEDLVPGDIIYLEADSEFGFISGDIRIVQSMLPVFVESYFLYKDCFNHLKEIKDDETSEDPLERNNLIFHGTSIFSGQCTGLVFQTGAKMLLSDVGQDMLATPVLPESEDEHPEIGDDLQGQLCLQIDNNDSIKTLCESFSSDPEKGLTTEQAAINREKSGKNKYRSRHGMMNYTKCKRDGEIKNILTRRLTIGDIVFLKAPQVAPADVRVIEATADCAVNKSHWFGLSGPQPISSEKTSDNPMDTQNLIFATTKITNGSCTALVIAVGKSTLGGQIGW